jgi:apolipoprotein N-acyltransferase
MLTEHLKKVVKFLWIIPAILLWASYPPVGERVDVFFALAPLMWLSRRGISKRTVKLWFINGFLFSFLTLAWMPAIVKNGGPLPLVVLGWSFLAAYLALFFAAFGYLSSVAWTIASAGGYYRRIAVILFVEPILWAGLELVRSTLFGGFAWNHLGVPLVNLGLGGCASVGGVYLASALVVLINGVAVSTVERMWKPFALPVPKYLRTLETLLPLFLVAGIFLFGGSFSKKHLSSPVPLRFAMIQRNFPSVFETDRKEDPLHEYTKLFDSVAHAAPDVLVLGESAMSEFGMLDSMQVEKFAKFALFRTGAKYLIAGGSRAEKGRVYNSAILYSDPGIKQFYDKVHLVPFGEFIPFDKTFTFLQSFAPVGTCYPGEPKVLDINGRQVGIAICFEDTDSALIRKFASLGADALVFITNDSWFYGSEETEQHAWQAVSRAVETGLPVIRTGNSGVSGTILPNGKPSWLTGSDGEILVDAAGVFVQTVFLCDNSGKDATIYVRWGDKPLWTLFVTVLVLMYFAKRYYQSYNFGEE